MKEQAQSLRQAIADADRIRAEAILAAGLRSNPDEFVERLRKEGVFRFARYDYAWKLLTSLVATALATPGINERSQIYLRSVSALATLVPEVRALFRSVNRAINPRSFKTYLVSLERLFREQYVNEYEGGAEHTYSTWKNFSKEELADAFSYYYSLLQSKATLTVKDINYIVSDKVRSDYYLQTLTSLAQIIRFREAEMLIEAFPFQATVSDNSVVVHAEHEEFEKCVRWGYIRYAQQRDADMAGYYARIDSDSNEREEGTREIKSMRDLAAIFVDKFGDTLFEKVGGSAPRVRIGLPRAPEFRQAFAYEDALIEESYQLRNAMKSLFVTFGDLRTTPVYKSITLHDVIRFQRLQMFICMALQEYCERRELIGTETYFRSIVAHVTESDAFALARDYCGIAQPEDLFDLLSVDVEGTRVFDVLYTPVFRAAGQYLIPSGIVCYSNLLRNVLQATRFRFDGEDAVDPVTDTLVAAFKSAGLPAAPRVKYSYSGQAGEIDVIAMVGDNVFAFECKNSLHPCNPHELRQTFGYISKAFDQLTRIRQLLKDPKFLSMIETKTGLPLGRSTGVTTSVVTGNRMFMGYERDGHSVRNVYELANVVTGGAAEFDFPKDMINFTGPREFFRFNFSNNSGMTGADLIDYLNGDSLHRVTLSAMVNHNQIIPFGRKKLTFQTFMLDLQAFTEQLRKHKSVTCDDRQQ